MRYLKISVNFNFDPILIYLSLFEIIIWKFAHFLIIDYHYAKMKERMYKNCVKDSSETNIIYKINLEL